MKIPLSKKDLRNLMAKEERCSDFWVKNFEKQSYSLKFINRTKERHAFQHKSPRWDLLHMGQPIPQYSRDLTRNTYMVQEHYVTVLPVNHVSILCIGLYVSNESHTQYTYMIDPEAQPRGVPGPSISRDLTPLRTCTCISF